MPGPSPSFPPPSHRRLTVVLALVVAAVLPAIAACGPAPRTAPGDQSGPSGDLAGHYTGSGGYVSALSFDVSQDDTLSNFRGSISTSCSLVKAGNAYNQEAMNDPENVDLDSDGSFSSTYDVPDTTASFTFNGRLDGHGGATGTVQYKNGACASITAPWSAAVKGVSPPPLPTITPTPDASSDCTPQPCLTFGDVVLTIQGFHSATWSAYGAAPALVLDLTITNNRSTIYEFTDQLLLNDGSHEGVGPGNGIETVTLGSGDTVACSHGISVQPDQTLNDLHWCYAQGALDVSQSIRLDWHSQMGSGSLDLGTPD